ncbi:unnamed protein product [Sphacelaria rigidula]
MRCGGKAHQILLSTKKIGIQKEPAAIAPRLIVFVVVNIFSHPLSWKQQRCPSAEKKIQAGACRYSCGGARGRCPKHSVQTQAYCRQRRRDPSTSKVSSHGKQTRPKKYRTSWAS